jgi:hypothetical protein
MANPLKWASQFNLICNTTQVLSTVGRNVVCSRVANRIGGGDVTHLALVFESSVLASGSTGNTAGIGNDYTVNSAVIEYNGVAAPLTFDGGNSSKLVGNWLLNVLTDELNIQQAFGVPSLPYNAQIFVKVQMTVPNTGTSRIPIASRNSETVTPQFLNVNPSVTTMSSPTAAGAWTSTGTAPTSNTFGYTPLIIGRHTSKNAVSFVLHGDSISAGSGDSGKTQTGYGWCGRILGNMPVIPGFLNLAVPSSNLLAGNVDPRLLPYYGYANFGISASATNDFTSSGTAQTVATVLSRQAIIRGRMKNQGVRKVGVMCTLAITSSTDGWTTTANQTVNAGWSAGGRPVTYNDTIKADLATYDFVVPQDALRDATDPFKWEVVGGAKTADGIHPNQAGYIELAAESQSLIETQIALALAPVAYTSAASGDWNNAATWSPAGVPTELDMATIAAGHTITVPSAFIAKHGGLAMSGTSVNASALTITGEVECHGNITRTEFSMITGAVDLNGYADSGAAAGGGNGLTSIGLTAIGLSVIGLTSIGFGSSGQSGPTSLLFDDTELFDETELED